MATVRKLTPPQIDEALTGAVDRAVPVTVSVRIDDAWKNFHARFKNRDAHGITLELPDQQAALPVAPGDTLGLSFKYRHHKHVFSTTVAALQDLTLRIDTPSDMQRLQRRAFSRAPVPEGKIVRASFWSGQLSDEPSVASPATPVWAAQVINLSAGGVQVRTDPTVADALDIGEPVGMHLTFRLGETALAVDALFRHQEPDGENVLLGFQFLGLEQTPQGQEKLEQIGRWVAEYQRLAERRG